MQELTHIDKYLEHARLKEHVSSMDGGLEAKVNEGGKSILFYHSLFVGISAFDYCHHAKPPTITRLPAYFVPP
jgi:hypothetical protein